MGAADGKQRWPAYSSFRIEQKKKEMNTLQLLLSTVCITSRNIYWCLLQKYIRDKHGDCKSVVRGVVSLAVKYLFLRLPYIKYIQWFFFLLRLPPLNLTNNFRKEYHANLHFGRICLPWTLKWLHNCCFTIIWICIK